MDLCLPGHRSQWFWKPGRIPVIACWLRSIGACHSSLCARTRACVRACVCVCVLIIFFTKMKSLCIFHTLIYLSTTSQLDPQAVLTFHDYKYWKTARCWWLTPVILLRMQRSGGLQFEVNLGK
jgi:hypothetical protein